MVSALKEIRPNELAPSPTNPRKHFDALKLEQLAASFAEKGIIEPLVIRLRVHADGEPPYEIVAGERRWRAAKIAELKTVPCIVRDLSDVEVLEVQTIENLQRDDLHPLEEAEGYDQLMKRAGYNVGQIAQKIGRSEKYVYDRVKLLQLTKEAKKIFLDGEITAGHAILLARLKPEDQEEAIGDVVGYNSPSGLFEIEIFDAQPGVDDEDTPRRKARSVRELDTWINDNVRFRPDEVDLPNLFPETQVALERAEEEELKVVKITRDYRVPDGAKDSKERTYGSAHWKRADGQSEYDEWNGKEIKSKTCEHPVMGVVVAGPGRGEAFLVCVNKKKCKVHWADERKRKAQTKSADSWQKRERRRREQLEERYKREDAERKRWEKARPRILRELAEKLKTAPAHAKSQLAHVLIGECSAYGGRTPKGLERGTTAEDLVRYCGFLSIAHLVSNSWRAQREAPKRLKAFGIDVKKILDEAAPKDERKKGGIKKGAAPKKRVQTSAKKKPVKKGTKPKAGIAS